ncbi:MAG: DNA replication/repair protein RecF [Woeseiaceae bacterium]|jgi:DNA replication and repair protein RecF
MPILEFSAQNFRCLEKIEFEADAGFNLIVGENASGKTSILEAIAYLGRGKSFRGAPTSNLIRHGEKEFVLFGRVGGDGRTSNVGVRNSAAGLEVRIDGDSSGGAAELAAALPLQIIDPDVHNLVAGAPEERRRYLDWIAFHVEHSYLASWRRFRRALKQRNAALKSGQAAATISGWNAEFVELAAEIDAGRRLALEAATEALEEAGLDLLGSEVRFEYRQGWKDATGLLEVLEAGLERDRLQGSTQMGPHRADVRLIYDERQARKLVSRGQQKLLACAMILAATETAQTALGRPLLLLLDDPAAELDGNSLARLMARVTNLGGQVIATALQAEPAIFGGAGAMFHVEHGALERVS